MVHCSYMYCAVLEAILFLASIISCHVGLPGCCLSQYSSASPRHSSLESHFSLFRNSFGSPRANPNEYHLEETCPWSAHTRLCLRLLDGVSPEIRVIMIDACYMH